MSEISPVPIRHHLDRRAVELVEDGAGNLHDLLSTGATADWLGVSPQWLEIGRSKGYGPPFVRLSPRRVRYRRDDVVGWLRERTHRSTAAYADQGRYADVGHRAHQLGFGHGAQQHEAADRHHHRAAHALHDSREDQHPQGLGKAAGDRAQGEDDDRAGEDAAGTKAVGGPAADRNEGPAGPN